MKRLLILNVLLFFLTTLNYAQTNDLTRYVNPLVGTYNSHALSYGNLYPAIALPFGMNFWTPQTGLNGDGWGYTYQADKICGFKQTHQPSPWINDYACFSMMPISSAKNIFTDKERYESFSHQNEVCKPYFYSVILNESKTKVEITPTERAAIFRFAFAGGQDNSILIDAFKGGSMLKWVVKDNSVVGYCRNNNGGVPENFKNYFVIKFNAPVKSIRFLVDGNEKSGVNFSEGNHVIAKVVFEGRKIIEARVASSFINQEQAFSNLNKEVGKVPFESILAKGKSLWNKQLNRVQVEGGSEDQMTTFYSCLYRMSLFPRQFYEYDKNNKPIYYSPYDGKVHAGYMFTDNGFWDTFRAVHPFFTLICPSMTAKIMQSLVAASEQSGFLPQWASPGHRDCMIGNNACALIADAYVKGIRNFDVQKALAAMVKDAGQQHPRMRSVGRLGWKEYDSLGYVPCDKYNEATARTLEYAFDDFCIAEVAEGIGNKDIAEKFYKKSYNYKNVFDPEVGWMRGRNADGSWRANFDPYEWGGPFTEGNSLHYTWSVFHNINDLIALMGGKDKFILKLDSIFSMPLRVNTGSYHGMIHEMTEMVKGNMGQYAHGNQPIQHMIYLYDHAGVPSKAQYWTREVMNRLYHPTPQGYCGDEDNGQTSAWYVMSAMGFYPATPGTTQYAMGSPLFKKITIHLENGKTFIIEAPQNSNANVYIGNATYNSKPYTKLYIDYSTFMAGGILKLDMQDNPKDNRMIQKEDLPFSKDK